MRRILPKVMVSAILLFLFTTTISSQGEPVEKLWDPITNPKPQSVLNHNLRNLAHSYTTRGTLEDYPSHFRITESNGEPSIRIEIRTKEADQYQLVKDLNKMGATDVVMYKSIINATIPLNDVESLEEKQEIQHVTVPWAITRTGSVTGQHVQAHDGGSLQGAPANLDGSGIKVGVMSDSFNCLSGQATDQGTGDLPGSITNLQEMSPCTGASDEGRALAQVVYDMAPGCQIYHHTAFNGMADFATGIGELVSAGCDIIVDDIIYFAETWYQDDAVAQAVNAADAAGVLYFSAAGNSKNGGYEHPTPGSVTKDGNDWLYFNGTDNDLDIEVQSGEEIYVTLQWDDPLQNIDTDLDLYLYTTVGSLVTSSTQVGVNSETIYWANGTNGTRTRKLRVDHYGGPVPGRFKVVIWGVDGIITESYGGVGTSTILAHSNAPGAIAVGAANYWQTPGYGVDPAVVDDDCPGSVCSSGSSHGGQLIVFADNGTTLKLVPQDRSKPDMVGAHGMNTTFFGSDIAMDADAFPNFFGTSASAPAVAGLAALILEANNNSGAPMSYAEYFNCITGATDDMGSGGYDVETGFGFFNAADAADCVSPGILPVVLSAFTITSNDCVNTLNWSASSERNFSHYSIEKSMNGSDFEEIARVAATGDLRSLTYSYEDLLPGSQSYYRLKMVDLDESYSYSTIKHIRSECDNSGLLVKLETNMVPYGTSELRFQLSDQSRIQKMMVTDLQGRILRSINISEKQLTGNFRTENLLPGMYFLIADDKLLGRVTQEFLIQ